jgi:vitamin B12 transporter
MRPTHAAALAALFILRAPITPANAQTAPANLPPDSPENLVVTATRIPSLADTIPAGVTVIDSATIAARGYVTLADALSAVPGLHLVQLGGPGGQTSVFIRGTNSNQVLVLRDGVPINDPADPGGAFNFGSDTLDDIDRIEVVRGAMSGLYGSGAIGGVINLISKPGQGPWHGSITAAGGAPRQGLLQGNAGGRSGIFDFAASAQGFSASGFDDTPRRESVYTGEVDGDRNKSAQIELGVTPFTGSDTRFAILLRARDQKYGYDDTPYDGGNATGYDAQLFGRLGVTSTLAAGAWQTSAFISRLQDDRRYTVTDDPADPNDDTQDNRYHGRRTDAQWNNTIHAGDLGPFHAVDVTLGYEHIAEQADAKINDLTLDYPPAYISTVKAHADTDSGTAGIQTKILGRLTATGQLREDATTIAGDAFTWRLGGVLAVPEIASHLHATYGTSFRAPALYDRYGIDDFGYHGNPDLKPERAQGWEAGWTIDLPVGAKRDSASLSLTYFDNRITDLIQIEYAANFLSSTPQNIPSARTRGVETALTIRAADWLSADLTYTYTDARAFGDVSPLLRRPANQGSADLRLSPYPALSIVPEILYIGSDRDYLTLNDGGFGPIGRVRSGLIVNLNITCQASPHIQLFLWGKNLGDSNYEPASGYQIPGTSFMAGTRVSF